MEQDFRSSLGDLERLVTFNLSVLGGRLVMQSAMPDREDGCLIELKCSWNAPLFGIFSNVVIGNERHRGRLWDENDENTKDEWFEGWSLSDCTLMVGIHPITEAWRRDNAEREAPIAGTWRYWKPVQSSDGVFQDKWPTVHASIFLGERNFHLLKSQLANDGPLDCKIILVVEFPIGAVSHRMIGSQVKWDGVEPLNITQAGIVWTKDDWDSKHDTIRERLELREERNLRADKYKEPSAREVFQKAVARTEDLLKGLTIPIWIAAIAAAIAAFRV